VIFMLSEHYSTVGCRLCKAAQLVSTCNVALCSRTTQGKASCFHCSHKQKVRSSVGECVFHSSDLITGAIGITIDCLAYTLTFISHFSIVMRLCPAQFCGSDETYA